MVIKRKDRILVFGFFGFRSNTSDGQDIKTRNLYDLLCEKMPDRITFFDTQSLRFRRFRYIVMLWRILSAGTVIYLPAQNNLKRFFPFLFGIRIYYFVVGGWLPSYIKGKQKLINRLKRIEHIFTETLLMKNALEQDSGFSNVSVCPNFRIHSFKAHPQQSNEKLKIVFMSRIMAQKGIAMVFKYASSVGEKAVIDFYGPVSAIDQEYFANEIEKHSNTNYRGFLDPTLIYSTLSEYDVLVLPTMFYTEGLPGAIIDAYIAGIPVVVTRWMHASEFVVHGSTGFIVPFENGYQEFEYALNEIDRDRAMLLSMKQNAMEYSRSFSSEAVWEVLKHIFK
jgi:glycosyltransferase involved in cell wall biosynthesis